MARNLKKCSQCKVELPLDDFTNDKQRSDGKRPNCKSCQKIRSKKYRSKEEVKERTKIKKQEYYKENKEKIISRNKAYRQANKEKFSQYSKKHSKKPEYRARKKEWFRKKITSDRIFFTKNKIEKLKSNYTKPISPYIYLMCDDYFFADWIGLEENNLNSRDNLDHIIPSSFAKNQCEFSALHHYSNFQILTDHQNKSKKSRYIRFNSLNKVLNNHPNPEVIHNIIDREDFKILFD